MSTLAENTTSLQEILNTVNSLPEAGTTTTETWTFTMDDGSIVTKEVQVE